jgi:hypothetical protein
MPITAASGAPLFIRVALTILVPGAAAAPAAASTGLAPSAVLAKVLERNPTISTYEAPLSIHFRERTFPFVGAILNGAAYYEKSGKFAVKFPSVPPPMRSFPKAYGSMMNVAGWPAMYDMAGGTPRSTADKDVALRLTPRDPSSDLNFAMIYVDPAAWTIDEMDWNFKHMECSITQTFRPLGEALVLGTQHAMIHVPFARVEVTTQVGDYKTNVAIAPAIFDGAQ